MGQPNTTETVQNKLATTTQIQHTSIKSPSEREQKDTNCVHEKIAQMRHLSTKTEEEKKVHRKKQKQNTNQ